MNRLGIWRVAMWWALCRPLCSSETWNMQPMASHGSLSTDICWIDNHIQSLILVAQFEMPLVTTSQTWIYWLLFVKLCQAVSVSLERMAVLNRYAAAFRCFGHKKLLPTIQSLQLETETRSLRILRWSRKRRDLEISTEPTWTLDILDISWYILIYCS